MSYHCSRVSLTAAGFAMRAQPQKPVEAGVSPANNFSSIAVRRFDFAAVAAVDDYGLAAINCSQLSTNHHQLSSINQSEQKGD